MAEVCHHCFDTYESVLILIDHCLILLISFVWFSYWKKRSKVNVKRAPKAPRKARHEGEGLKTYLFLANYARPRIIKDFRSKSKD